MSAPETGSLDISVVCESEAWGEPPRKMDELIRHAIQVASEMAGLDRKSSELAVVLTDDETQRELNRRWRGKDAPTNVLSFPASPTPVPGPHLLGDVVLAFETVAREAREEEKAFEAHVAHLAVHGFLHLLDYDHENDTQAATMEELEARIMTRLGFDDPYAEKGPSGDAHG